MKNILIASDFSEYSENAMNYAVQFAKESGSALTLFHAYNIPVPVTEVPVVMVTGEELQKAATEGLEKLKEKISAIAPEVPVSIVTRAGLPATTIGEAVKESRADLVVMGMRGMGRLEKALLGSTTTAYFRRTSVPVLIVPENASFKNPRHIVLAYDYKEEPKKNELSPLLDFISTFHMKLSVLNVLKEPAEVSVGKAVAGLKLEHALQGVDHTLHFPVADSDITDEIEKFVAERDADMIAMISHKHSFIENVFNRSHTRKMAFHTHIPLLVIPELKTNN